MTRHDHVATQQPAKPTLGMMLAFKDSETNTLAGIPAKAIYIWPRFRSGDYLVTLEYAHPVRFKNALITHIDAFVSELRPIDQATYSASTTDLPRYSEYR